MCFSPNQQNKMKPGNVTQDPGHRENHLKSLFLNRQKISTPDQNRLSDKNRQAHRPKKSPREAGFFPAARMP
jgi:hypothetical protein